MLVGDYFHKQMLVTYSLYDGLLSLWNNCAKVDGIFRDIKFIRGSSPTVC